MTIFLTGSSGFIGQQVARIFGIFHTVTCYQRDTPINITSEVVVHAAGVAHDLHGALDAAVYYQGNTVLTRQVFAAFLGSSAHTFIFLSSVKAVADQVDGVLTEEQVPTPVTVYGKSKLAAEDGILGTVLPPGKRVYVLRLSMVHGPGNKGNLNELYAAVSRGIPWLLGRFENKRSFCAIENLLFVLNELMSRTDIPSGVYQVSDGEALSTHTLIELIGYVRGRPVQIWNIPKPYIRAIARVGDAIGLPLNSDRLQKLTSSFEVANTKLLTALGKPLPVTARQGLINTFKWFQVYG